MTGVQARGIRKNLLLADHVRVIENKLFFSELFVRCRNLKCPLVRMSVPSRHLKRGLMFGEQVLITGACLFL